MSCVGGEPCRKYIPRAANSGAVDKVTGNQRCEECLVKIEHDASVQAHNQSIVGPHRTACVYSAGVEIIIVIVLIITVGS